MKTAAFTTTLIAGLLALGTVALANPQPAPDPPAPPSVEVPTEGGGSLQVIEVGATWVNVRGISPVATDTFFVSLEPLSSGGRPRIEKVKFHSKIKSGNYKFGRLQPDTTYQLRIQALDGRSQRLLGAVRFHTEKIYDSGQLPRKAPKAN